MLAPWQPLLEWWFGWGSSPRPWLTRRARCGSASTMTMKPVSISASWSSMPWPAADEWQQSPQGWLGLLLLLDQLPRMIYRDTPRAFDGDRRAQVIAMQGLQKGWDYQLLPIQRVFVLLVLEHAEVLDWQNLCVERYQMLLDEQPMPGCSRVSSIMPSSING